MANEIKISSTEMGYKTTEFSKLHWEDRLGVCNFGWQRLEVVEEAMSAIRRICANPTQAPEIVKEVNAFAVAWSQNHRKHGQALLCPFPKELRDIAVAVASGENPTRAIDAARNAIRDAKPYDVVVIRNEYGYETPISFKRVFEADNGGTILHAFLKQHPEAVEAIYRWAVWRIETPRNAGAVGLGSADEIVAALRVDDNGVPLLSFKARANLVKFIRKNFFKSQYGAASFERYYLENFVKVDQELGDGALVDPRDKREIEAALDNKYNGFDDWAHVQIDLLAGADNSFYEEFDPEDIEDDLPRLAGRIRRLFRLYVPCTVQRMLQIAGINVHCAVWIEWVRRHKPLLYHEMEQAIQLRKQLLPWSTPQDMINLVLAAKAYGTPELVSVCEAIERCRRDGTLESVVLPALATYAEWAATHYGKYDLIGPSYPYRVVYDALLGNAFAGTGRWAMECDGYIADQPVKRQAKLCDRDAEQWMEEWVEAHADISADDAKYIAYHAKKYEASCPGLTEFLLKVFEDLSFGGTLMPHEAFADFDPYEDDGTPTKLVDTHRWMLARAVAYDIVEAGEEGYDEYFDCIAHSEDDDLWVQAAEALEAKKKEIEAFNAQLDAVDDFDITFRKAMADVFERPELETLLLLGFDPEEQLKKAIANDGRVVVF